MIMFRECIIHSVQGNNITAASGSLVKLFWPEEGAAITDSKFISNQAFHGKGGAIAIIATSENTENTDVDAFSSGATVVEIDQCEFSGNQACFFIINFLNDEFKQQLLKYLFRFVKTTKYVMFGQGRNGGALWVGHAGLPVLIVGCEFLGNYASGGDGGALWSKSQLKLRSTTCSNNRCVCQVNTNKPNAIILFGYGVFTL